MHVGGHHERREDISVGTKLGIYLFDLLKIHPSLRVSGCAYKILQLDSKQQLHFLLRKRNTPKPTQHGMQQKQKARPAASLQGQRAGRPGPGTGGSCQAELAA